MMQPTTFRLPGLFALLIALLVSAHGCGSGSSAPAPGAGVKPREGLAVGLPLRVNLESEVIPDAVSGESSKTVDDALKHMKATLKNGKLYDSKGNEIHFETKMARKSGATRKVPLGSAVIKLVD